MNEQLNWTIATEDKSGTRTAWIYLGTTPVFTITALTTDHQSDRHFRAYATKQFADRLATALSHHA
jgi:hypothetical protein